MQEFGKIEVEVKQFMEEACKTLEAVDQRFDSKSSAIVQKFASFEVGQKEFSQRTEKLKGQVVNLESKTTKLDETFRFLEEDFKQLEDDLSNLHRAI